MTDPLSLPTPNLPTPNLPLLRKVLDHIDAHPDEWDQRWWEQQQDPVRITFYKLPKTCGTTRCVAGWVQHFETGSVDDDVEEYAQEALGLTTFEAMTLFHSSAEVDDRTEQRARVQVVAESIAARAGEVL